MIKETWNVLSCKASELKLIGTLNGGQSFRWALSTDNGKEEWIGVFAKKVWILKQENDNLLYKVYDSNKHNEIKDYGKLLADYFRLDLDLKEHYEKWCKSDELFKSITKEFYGIRMLNQEIVENLFSFICSSNNNITRISSMVEKLALFYGEKICTIGEKDYYSFPTIEALAQNNVEQKLRDNGFGYRSKYIAKSAQYILENGGNKWIDSLKLMEYEDAKKTLMCLTGVGAKVADCICLMSLGHLQAIPVDTHIYQIVSRLYMPQLSKRKTVTDQVYNSIGNHFRNLYGPLAGWAQTILFCADLKKFQN